MSEEQNNQPATTFGGDATIIPPSKFPPQPSMRTYESDVAEVLSHKKTSTASIAIAESRKKGGDESLGSTGESSQFAKKIIIALISLIFIGGGVIGGYYLYSISPLAPATQVATSTPAAVVTAIPADAHVAIAIDNLSLTRIIDAIRTEVAKPQTRGTVKEIILTEVQNGQRYRVTLSEMIKIMDINPPDTLLRAISDTPMLAVYANPNGTKDIFVLATVNYFQNAFAGMLQWENNIPDDLKEYLYQNVPQGITTEPIFSSSTSKISSSTSSSTSKVLASSTSNKKVATSTKSGTVASTTASTTMTFPEPTIVPYTIIHGSYVDRIIKNKDVREFVSTNGNILFLYSFIDDKKLVITSTESTLEETINRLEKQAYVR